MHLYPYFIWWHVVEDIIVNTYFCLMLEYSDNNKVSVGLLMQSSELD